MILLRGGLKCLISRRPFLSQVQEKTKQDNNIRRKEKATVVRKSGLKRKRHGLKNPPDSCQIPSSRSATRQIGTLARTLATSTQDLSKTKEALQVQRAEASRLEAEVEEHKVLALRQHAELTVQEQRIGNLKRQKDRVSDQLHTAKEKVASHLSGESEKAKRSYEKSLTQRERRAEKLNEDAKKSIASSRKKSRNLADKESLQADLDAAQEEIRRQGLKLDELEAEKEDAEQEEDEEDKEGSESDASNWSFEMHDEPSKTIDGYPPKLVYLFLQMLGNGVSTVKAPTIFKVAAEYFDPKAQIADGLALDERGKWKVPSQSAMSRWRQSLGVLALLQAAITLAKCKSYTLHSDQSTKKLVKVGTAVLRCQMPGVDGGDDFFEVVALGGIFSLAGGTAQEALEQFMGVLTQAEQLMQRGRTFFKGNCPDISKKDLDSLIPDVKPGKLGREVPGTCKEVSAALQSDSANAALLTSKLLQDNFTQFKHAVTCGDHLRTNMADEAVKATNKIVEGMLGTREAEEFSSSTNITSTFIRALFTEFHSNYEFGQKTIYSTLGWMRSTLDSALICSV